jgi:hypothetical protein
MESPIGIIGIVFTIFAQTSVFAFILGGAFNRIKTLERWKEDQKSEEMRSEKRVLDLLHRMEHEFKEALGRMEREFKEGMSYFGGVLGNVVVTMNDHESRIHVTEKASSISSQRRPAIKIPKSPEWMPPQGRVPEEISTGQFRAGQDPRRDPNK